MSGIFLKVVNMSISASWIVLAVLLLRVLFKKAPKWITVLLWGIVAIRLICPLSIESVMSLIPSAETISPEIMMDRTPEINSGVPIINGVINPIIGESFTPDPAASANPLQIWIPIFSFVWIAGIAVMLTYTIISYFRVNRKIGTAILLRNNIFQSENVVSPFVLGVIKPKIYLPFCIDGQDMEYVIAHENAHIRRKDHLWKPFGFLVLTLHWFNPLMWLGYVLLCRDIELACDEKVIKTLDAEQKADYSQALLTCSVNRRMIAACPLAFGEVGVRDRVKSVLNYKKPAFWIIIVAVIASVGATVCFLTNPISSNEKDLSARELFAVCVNDKWGYIDKRGQYVIAPQFDTAWNFADDGLAVVELNDKWGYIDETGQYVIEPQFDHAYDFADNGLAVIELNDKWGYIDETGQYVIEPQFNYAWNFADNGLAMVQMNGKYGFVDKTGQYAIAPQFKTVLEFADNGLAMVIVNGKCGFIDETGQYAIEPQFDYAYTFGKDGLADVGVNGKHGYIDKSDQYVIEPQFDSRGVFSDNGLAMVGVNDKYGFIDKTGQYAIEPQFDEVGPFAANGLARVRVNGKCGYIDERGNYVIEPKFDEVGYFGSDRAMVKVNGKWGYIDKHGRYAIDPQFDEVGPFAANGLARVKANGKYGYIDKRGKYAIEPQFAFAWDFEENGLAMVEVNGKYGFIDKNGQYVIEPLLDHADPMH